MHPFVLTLVGDGLDHTHVESVRESLCLPMESLGPPEWLAPMQACDLPFSDLDLLTAEARARERLQGAPFDLAAQSEAGRRKRLLVADMESTVIRNEMLDELADFVGKRSEVEDITALAMAGELDFAGSVCARVGLLRGLATEVVTSALKRIEIDPGAHSLVATMRAHGAFTALVSGGFGAFAEPVQRQLGFDVYRANEFRVSAGRLTGEVVEPILDRTAKLEALTELCSQRGIEAVEAVAVGDGANDLAMISAAGLGVAFHAKPAVVAAARYNVRFGDLRTLLYFQGYRRLDLVD